MNNDHLTRERVLFSRHLLFLPRFAWWPRRGSRTKVRNPRRGSFRNVTHKYFTHTGFRIECKVLNIGEKVDDNEGSFYIIEWSDGSPTGCLIHSKPVEKGDFLGIARTVLIRNVNEQTHRSINNIATDIIETNKPPLGFIVQESKTTNYLINAIYYDLWDLISKNEPVYICANPNCKLPFKKVKRQKYCSNACKQEAYRIRKKQKQS